LPETLELAADDRAPMPIAIARAEFERQYLRALLARTGGNVAETARIANMSRRGIYDMLTRLAISGPWQGSLEE